MLERRCLHCDNPQRDSAEEFCCSGCAAAYGMLQAAGLDRYYALRDGPGVAAPGVSVRLDPWVEAAEVELSSSPGELFRLDADLQGIRCSACVWLIERVFEQQAGAVSAEVNPGLGTLRVFVRPGQFSVRAFARTLGQLGYRLGARAKTGAGDRASPLLRRIGVCAALSLNVMMFSLAVYCGLDRGPLYLLMTRAGWALTLAVVLYGGRPFFDGAIGALRHRALHLDVPIALGVGLAFLGSTYALFVRGAGSSYVDTVSVFVTLMLVGRFLQERVLEQNRRALLQDDGVENLYCHVVEGDSLRAVRVSELRAGSRLLLRPGDLVPVDAALERGDTVVTREWITGESGPATVREGERIEAGSFHAGPSAVTALAASDFGASRLCELLRRPVEGRPDLARTTPFWARLSRGYVAATLLTAALTGLGWWWHGEGARALEVVVAVLVVACPCAFGIAVPIGYEIVQARLRRAGVFVRSPSLLDRAPQVRQIVFDKTGTLTLGGLEVEEPAALAALAPLARRALWNLAARSNHPKSQAIRAALAPLGEPLLAELRAEERPGLGLSLAWGGHDYRLGSAAWAAPGCPCAGDVVFARDGVCLLSMTTRETVRPEARRELSTLQSEGYALHLVSGDREERVGSLGRLLGIDPARTAAEASPEQKSAYVRKLGRDDVLMVGDGVNDAAALGAALCSVTPAGDLPFLPARTDAYVQGPLVTGIRRLLEEARRLDRAVRAAVAFGAGYNVAAVAVAASGHMSPLAAAVLMPLSSALVVTGVAMSLRGEAPPTPAPLPLAAPAAHPAGAS